MPDRTSAAEVELARKSLYWRSQSVPLGVRSDESGVRTIMVRQVSGSLEASGAIALDSADRLPIRAYAMGDGSFALSVAPQRLGAFVTARVLVPVTVDGRPVLSEGVPVLTWNGDYERVTDQNGTPVTVYV